VDASISNRAIAAAVALLSIAVEPRCMHVQGLSPPGELGPAMKQRSDGVSREYSDIVLYIRRPRWTWRDGCGVGALQ
jgi:hypothetical protein